MVRGSMRAQASYKVSFWADLGTQGLLAITEFLELWIILRSVKALGGMDFAQVASVFGLATCAFSLADLVLGNMDRVHRFVREGRLETLLVRPMPLLVQLVGLDLSLRRLGRTFTATVILVVALHQAGFTPTPSHLVLLVIALISGAAIFGALFVLAGSVQFWIVNAAEVLNAFTYGGHHVAEYPASVFWMPMRVFFTYVIPSSIVAYAPMLVIFDLPGPPGVPQWLGWCGPIVALVIWAMAMLAWRQGIRHYTGAGG